MDGLGPDGAHPFNVDEASSEGIKVSYFLLFPGPDALVITVPYDLETHVKIYKFYSILNSKTGCVAASLFPGVGRGHNDFQGICPRFLLSGGGWGQA